MMMLLPLTFPGDESVARWEACELADFTPSSGGKLGNEFSQCPLAAIDPVVTGPGEREQAYCVRQSLMKAEAEFARYRGEVARCLGKSLGSMILIGVVCASAGVGWAACFGFCSAAAVAVAAGCLRGACCDLRANMLLIRAWFVECCAEHECPGYEHP